MVLYYITALGGILPQCIISLKSARVNLETLNIKVNDSKAILIHAAFMILIPIYILFVSEDFLGNFQMFLSLLGIGLAAWAAAFMMDYILIRRDAGYEERLLTDDTYNGVNVKGVLSWILGVAVGLLFTSSPFFNGPFATGIFEGNSMGLFLTFIVSAAVFYFLTVAVKKDFKMDNKKGTEV